MSREEGFLISGDGLGLVEDGKHVVIVPFTAPGTFPLEKDIDR